MIGDGKEKDTKDAPDSECSSSQEAKFSGKNMDEIQKQENCAQEQKESANDIVDDQKYKGIDAVDIESVKLEATDSMADMDKHEDLNFNKDNEKTTSVTPKIMRSKVEVKKGVANAGRKIESTASNTLMVTRSNKKEKKDLDCNKSKATQKTMKDEKAAGTSEGIKSPTKKLFEYKTKLASKNTNKVQVSKSPANADLKSPRAKAATGFHASKSPANSESKLLRNKDNTGLTVSKSPENTELKSPRTKATTGVGASKPPVISETRSVRNKSNTGLLVPKSPAISKTKSLRTKSNSEMLVSKSPANAESKTVRTKAKTGSIVSKSPANANSKSQSSKVNAEPNLISPKPLLEDAILKTVDEQKQPLESEVTEPNRMARAFESISQVAKQENYNEQIQQFDSNETDLNPEVCPSKPLLGDSILKGISEQTPLDSTITEPITELNACEPLSQDLILKNIEDQKQPLESTVTARNIAINTPDEQIQQFDPNETDLNPEVCPSKPLLEDFILKNFNEQKPLNSTITEPSTELNACEPLPQDLMLKNIEDQKQSLESTVTVRNKAINTPLQSFQDSMIMAIDENFRKLDLDASEMEQNASLVNQNINVHQGMENEKIINLNSDVNLSYEFDEHDNKNILVDNKDRYNVDVNQKITFNIGENAKISFIDGKVFISTTGGQIVCSMQRNRAVFSINENTRKSDSLPEDQRSSDVQQSLQDSLNNFVTNIKTNCENFEYNFLKSLE